MGISAVNITSDPTLLRTYAPVDLFKLRFPDATAVLNPPGAVNTSNPALLQASLPADAFSSLYLGAVNETGTQAAGVEGTSATATALAPNTTTAQSYLVEADKLAQAQIQGIAAQDTSVAEDAVVPEAPDSMSAMLRGMYLAPVASRFYLAPYRSGLSASAEESMQDVLAPTPSFPASEYAQGHPSNAKAYVRHLPVSHGVIEAYAAVVPHTLDVVA